MPLRGLGTGQGGDNGHGGGKCPNRRRRCGKVLTMGWEWGDATGERISVEILLCLKPTMNN